MSSKTQLKFSVFNKKHSTHQSKPKSKTQKTSPNSILSKALNPSTKSKTKTLFGTSTSKVSSKPDAQNLQLYHSNKPPTNSLLLSNKIYNNLSPGKPASTSLSTTNNNNNNTKPSHSKMLRQIPFKPLYKAITTPSTSKHSRKSSNDYSGSICLHSKQHTSKGMSATKNTFFMYNNNNNNNSNNKVKYVTSTNSRHNNFNIVTNSVNTATATSAVKHQSQATSINKVKNLNLQNTTNDVKSLLSKYSIVSSITNPSTNCKLKHVKHSTNMANHFNMSKSYIKQVNQMKLSSSSYYPNKPLLLQQNEMQNTFNILIHSSNNTKQNLKRFYPNQHRNNTNNNFNTKDNSGYSLIQNINTSESKGKTVTKTISNISSRITNNNNNNTNTNTNTTELVKSKDNNNTKHNKKNTNAVNGNGSSNINTKLTNKFNRKHILHNIDLIFIKHPSYTHTKTTTTTTAGAKKEKEMNVNYHSYNTHTTTTNNNKTNVNNNNKKHISISSTANPSFSNINKRNAKSKSRKSTTVKTVLTNLSSPNHNLNTLNKHINTLSTNTEIINHYNTNNDDSLLNSSNNSNNNNNNQSYCSTIRESNYYFNESKHISEMIVKYMRSHKEGEYPKTTMKFYKIGRRIGHGGFGKVNIGLHVLSGHIVAIKSFNKSKEHYSESKIQYEVQLMKKLRGYKNIVKFFEDVNTEKYYCIIMENISGGNLLSLINKRTKLPEQTAKYIFKQLIETLKFIHSQNIAHRDIKPDNILIDLNNTIKICDFGVSKEIKNGQLLYDPCGTPAFVAPEVLGTTPYDPFKTDIWSCGVVLYSMVSGFFPFRGNNDYELHQSILNGEYPSLVDVSVDLQDLIDKILEVDVSKRITLNDILNHKWLCSDTVNIIQYEFTNLFTNAEKIIYSKLSVDYRCARKEDLMENFTYKNIISELENENQNNYDKSIVNAPFNTKIRPYLDYEDDVFFEDLNIENSLMKFLPKAQELNLKYEVNYNAEADQGIVKNPRKGNRRIVMSSFNNSLIIQQNEQKEEHNGNGSGGDNNNKNHRLSSRSQSGNDEDKLNENDKPKETECVDVDGEGMNDNNKEVNSHNHKLHRKNQKDTLSTSSNTFYIDDNALKFVEDFGFKRDYILRSLENNETNHATATYYLKLSLLNE